MNTANPSARIKTSRLSSWEELNGEPLRVWFNQTYGTNYWIVKMVKDNPDSIPVHAIATSDKIDSPVLLAGDEYHLEPSRDLVTGNDYVDWALNFCKMHSIDVLVPMREIASISARKEEFASLGVAVLASPADSINLLEDKNLAYLSARDNGIPVPPWRMVSSVQEFTEAYDSLLEETQNRDTICIKPNEGVGGQGYRRIVTASPELKDLLIDPKHVIELSVLLDVFKRTEDAGQKLPEFMLMPYLDEPETSVDCLSDTQGSILAAVPRAKTGRKQHMPEDAYEAIEIATQMVKVYGLSYLTNTQTRVYNGHAVLLETNTRISGGMYASPLAGVNMPWEGIKLALFGSIEKPQVTLGAEYSSVPYLIRTN